MGYRPIHGLAATIKARPFTGGTQSHLQPEIVQNHRFFSRIQKGAKRLSTADRAHRKKFPVPHPCDFFCRKGGRLRSLVTPSLVLL